jgi:hypothetical protein
MRRNFIEVSLTISSHLAVIPRWYAPEEFLRQGLERLNEMQVLDR